MRDVGLPFLLTRLLFLAITLTAPQWRALAVPDTGRYLSSAAPVGSLPLSRWYNWDAAWYLRIAGNGLQMGYSRYTENPSHHFSTFAFFPLYPLTVRALGVLIPGALDAVPAGGTPRPGLLVAALLVANLTFIAGLIALYLWARSRAGPAAGRRAVWLLCLFPTTVFFSAPYSESMFFLWLVLFFLMLDRRSWLLAGLCGGLAAATRSFGVTLMLPYLVAALLPAKAPFTGTLRRRWPDGARRWTGLQWSSVAARIWPMALIPLGLVAYVIYLWVAWDKPFLFQDAEKAWGRTVNLPWVGIIDGLMWSLRKWPHLPQQNWRGLTDALYAVVFLGLTTLAWRDIDWVGRSYAVVFWLFMLCEPQITDPNYPDTLISMARFLLMLLPLWLWLARSRWRTWIFAVPSTLLLLFYAARWVNRAWIG